MYYGSTKIESYDFSTEIQIFRSVFKQPFIAKRSVLKVAANIFFHLSLFLFLIQIIYLLCCLLYTIIIVNSYNNKQSLLRKLQILSTFQSPILFQRAKLTEIEVTNFKEKKTVQSLNQKISPSQHLGALSQIKLR